MLRNRSWEPESETLERSESGVGNFGKSGAGVGYFTSGSATLVGSNVFINPKR